MPLYLNAGSVAESLARLQRSSAQSRLCEYLIGLRTLALAGEDHVQVAESIPQFVQALRELTECAPAGVPTNFDGQPYINPFGTARGQAAGRAYKSRKFPSNGPSNTMFGWATQQDRPIDIITDTRPKGIKRRAITQDQLRRFLLLKGPSLDERPRLIDAAVWYFRAKDLDARFGAEPTDERLMAAFVDDIALTNDEVDALFFSQKPETHGAITFSSAPADPDAYLPQRAGGAPLPVAAAGTLQSSVQDVVSYIAGRGFNFQPWQVAAFITAVRTKPFVILAGISGTGKTKLPQLVAEATDADCRIVPVRPDWTDSSDLLGYERLDGDFSPGHLLRLCREAASFPDRQYFFVLDEMNIARVEYYFAEVLSALETRSVQNGLLASAPLSPRAPQPWESVRLPGNVCIVGTVNMDETTHGFSRKVLDRAFVIELADVDLSLIQEIDPNVMPAQWPIANWRVLFPRLADLPKVDQDERVTACITALTDVNEVLEPGQLQVGYRVRDEVALFCVNAGDCADSFVAADETVVSPLDLCITMKVLPRIQGGGALVRQVLEGLKAWVAPDAGATANATTANAEFAQTLKRVDLMLTRLAETGFTSYWM